MANRERQRPPSSLDQAALAQVGGTDKTVALLDGRKHRRPMMQWLSRWRGWMILVVLAVAFFPHFGKGNDGAAKQRYLSCLSFTVAFIAVSLAA